MNIEQANGIAMTEILRKIGCRPVKQRGDEVWYLSPFRDEKTASFKVHTGKNLWYDFGAGKGGDVVKFACDYLITGTDGTGVSSALKWLRTFSACPRIEIAPAIKQQPSTVRSLEVVRAYELRYRILTNYVESRGIPLELAQEFLKEVLVRNEKTGREFRAIGLYNEAEGYEICTEDFKGSIGSKSISFIRGTKLPASEIHIFEGMWDFLAAFSQHPDQHFEGDVIILNSTSCLPQAFPYIKNYHNYRKLTTWLDNDEAGNNATDYLKELAEKEGLEFEAMNECYKSFKDLNEWHVNNLKPMTVQKPSL